MDISSFYLIGSLLAGFGLGYFIADRNSKSLLELQEKNSDRDKDFENAFKAIASDIAISNRADFLKLANSQFKNLSKESDTNLENKKKLIDENLGQMSKRLKSIEDASIKLNENLEATNTQTKDLTDTTVKLREILSSSQKRGQWGERIVEDILDVIGLIEGINYTKQAVVDSGERPDFTFILPKEKTESLESDKHRKKPLT